MGDGLTSKDFPRGSFERVARQDEERVDKRLELNKLREAKGLPGVSADRDYAHEIAAKVRSVENDERQRRRDDEAAAARVPKGMRHVDRPK